MLKRVVLLNFDVGDSFNLVGSVIKRWLIEAKLNVVEIKEQTLGVFVFEQLLQLNPDYIVINEPFPRSQEAAMFYKKVKPDVKIIVFVHDHWLLLKDWNSPFYYHVDGVYCLNGRAWEVVLNIPGMPACPVFNLGFPMPPDEFTIKRLWKEREKKFVYIGALLPMKISVDFLYEIQKTSVKIDLYGKLRDKQDLKVYNKALLSCSNLIYKGYVPQRSVSAVLNEYQYYVLPHDGAEVFNLSLLQAIMCGTIPLITNDEDSHKYDGKWLKWADSCYYGCETAKELVDNLVEIDKEKPDESENSEVISDYISKKYEFFKYRDHFHTFLEKCGSTYVSQDSGADHTHGRRVVIKQRKEK
jgi:hypothetical protein